MSALAYIYFRYKNLSLLQHILAALRPAVVALIASAGISILLQVAFPGTAGDVFRANWQGIALFAAAFAILRIRKWNPILVMTLCGAAGLLLGIVTG